MNATCTVCGKSFPYERGAATASCPYCYTDYKVRGGKLVAAEDDENLAPTSPPASAGASSKKKKKRSKDSAGGHVPTKGKVGAPGKLEPQPVPAALEFADEEEPRPKKKKKKPRSGSGSASGSSRQAASGRSSSSGSKKKKKKAGRTFEEEVAELAERQPDKQKGFARAVVITTVVLLLGGGIAAYLILDDYFSRRSENPLLNEQAGPPGAQDATTGPPTAASEGEGAPQGASPGGPVMPVAELVEALYRELEQPSVAGMQRVIRQVEVALTEEDRLDRRQRNELHRLGVRAEQGLESLMAISQGELHLELLERAETAERQGFELYFAQQAARHAERELSGRDEELAATRSRAEALREQVRERRGELRHASDE